jgi:hypothetical protein
MKSWTLLFVFVMGASPAFAQEEGIDMTALLLQQAKAEGEAAAIGKVIGQLQLGKIDYEAIFKSIADCNSQKSVEAEGRVFTSVRAATRPCRDMARAMVAITASLQGQHGEASRIMEEKESAWPTVALRIGTVLAFGIAGDMVLPHLMAPTLASIRANRDVTTSALENLPEPLLVRPEIVQPVVVTVPTTGQ